MANKITAAGKMTPAQFSSAASETETLARSVYLKLHALKNEMDSWESHDGMADFNERQQKIYSLIMKAADEANKTISTTHQMWNEVKNYVSSGLKETVEAELLALGVEVKDGKVRKSDVEAYLANAISSSAQEQVDLLKKILNQIHDAKSTAQQYDKWLRDAGVDTMLSTLSYGLASNINLALKEIKEIVD